MKGIENPILYNKEGKVDDSKIAEEMAYTEKPFREKKFLGIFKPSKVQIALGEKISEHTGEKLAHEKEKQLDYDLINELEYLAHRLGEQKNLRGNIDHQDVDYDYKTELDGAEIRIVANNFFNTEGFDSGWKKELGKFSNSLGAVAITIDGANVAISELSAEFKLRLFDLAKEKTSAFVEKDTAAMKEKSERKREATQKEEQEQIAKKSIMQNLLGKINGETKEISGEGYRRQLGEEIRYLDFKTRKDDGSWSIENVINGVQIEIRINKKANGQYDGYDLIFDGKSFDYWKLDDGQKQSEIFFSTILSLVKQLSNNFREEDYSRETEKADAKKKEADEKEADRNDKIEKLRKDGIVK